MQVSKEAQILIPPMSTEEALGMGPCFYLSPSSSEVTKAKEELFRALTDMLSSCTRLQGRTVRAPITVLTETWWFDKKHLTEVWDYHKHKGLN